jgi:hypothetical protein
MEQGIDITELDRELEEERKHLTTEELNKKYPPIKGCRVTKERRQGISNSDFSITYDNLAKSNDITGWLLLTFAFASTVLLVYINS